MSIYGKSNGGVLDPGTKELIKALGGQGKRIKVGGTVTHKVGLIEMRDGEIGSKIVRGTGDRYHRSSNPYVPPLKLRIPNPNQV